MKTSTASVTADEPGIIWSAQWKDPGGCTACLTPPQPPPLHCLMLLVVTSIPG
ncbi:hypothetical protein DAI22_12g118000 [Oryza sativa Japonica Group]|nr:hypothetical protein DAI22_12g118000 [Oryza sativa Japonica Group]